MATPTPWTFFLWVWIGQPLRLFPLRRKEVERVSALLSWTGQGGLQLAELTLAFVLSALVGAEREIRQKSAGLRTHTLVGVSAALFMLISKSVS
jgi:hypothetical protein